MFHTLPEDRIEEVLERLPLMGLPNLWIPRRNQFFRLETFPRLASGKTDWRTLREMALGLAARKEIEDPAAR